MPTWLFFLTHFTVIAYALVAGVFLAFSDFIMRSLSLTGPATGAVTMQTINREVFRWIFMALFLGLAPVSLVVAGHGVLHLATPVGALMTFAGLVYLAGCFGVTVVFNVPMNEALAKMDADTSATQAYWTGTYLPRWTFWNTVRTGASALSALLLLVAISWMAHSQGQAG